MADSRAKDLVKRTLSSLADITGVRLWSDKSGDSDAKGIELSEFVSSDVVANTSIDYKALTPKGFYNSTASTNRRGVVSLASLTDIENRVGAYGLTANNVNDLIEETRKDFYSQNGVAQKSTHYGGAGVDKATVSTYCNSTNSAPQWYYFKINPNLPTGTTIRAATVILSMYAGNGNYITGTYTVSGGADSSKSISADWNLDISADGTGLVIQNKSTNTFTSASVAATVHIIHW